MAASFVEKLDERGVSHVSVFGQNGKTTWAEGVVLTTQPVHLRFASPVSQSGAGNYVADTKDKGTWHGDEGRGQNCWYNIVRFVGVVVTDNSNGLNVQPAAVSDSSIKLTNINPAGKPASGQLNTFFAAPKLTY